MSTETSLSRRELGQRGEEFVAQYLTRTLGWRVEARNWRCRTGELDIVASDRSDLVVVEVRSRSGHSFGTAAESVVGGKLRQVRRLLPHLLLDLGRSAEESSLRIDVIAVALQRGRVCGLQHFHDVDIV